MNTFHEERAARGLPPIEIATCPEHPQYAIPEGGICPGCDSNRKILSGEIGNFAGIPVFTDCAAPPWQFVIGPDALSVIEVNKDLPHSCTEEKRCSRWQLFPEVTT